MLSRCLAQGSSATTRSRAGVSRAPAGQRCSMIRLSLRSGWLIRKFTEARPDPDRLQNLREPPALALASGRRHFASVGP